MKKAILTVAAAVTLAAATMTAPTPAAAYHHHHHGGGIGLGLLGLGAGVVLGAAIAGHPGYYAYEYDGPPPMDCDGYWARRRIYDRYGNQIGWSRPHWFCR
jgi:hypothetical protein